MTAQEQGTGFDRTENETHHYCEAERWLAAAKREYVEEHGEPEDPCVEHNVTRLLQIAAVEASLAQAADIDRSAEAQSRLSRAVPEEGSALRVAPVGR